MGDNVRSSLDALIREHGEDYSSVSRLLGRNPAYIQQFIKRGTPRRLAEEDRLKLARYFRVSEERLGGRPDTTAELSHPLVPIPRIEISASAGSGGIADIEEHGSPIAFDLRLFSNLGVRRSTMLSIIRVAGDSMEPTLRDGDDILVERNITSPHWNSIHVFRHNELLMVKRIIRGGRGTVVIRSDNDAYPDIIVDGTASIRLIGRVLWCGRRLV